MYVAGVWWCGTGLLWVQKHPVLSAVIWMFGKVSHDTSARNHYISLRIWFEGRTDDMPCVQGFCPGTLVDESDPKTNAL